MKPNEPKPEDKQYFAADVATELEISIKQAIELLVSDKIRNDYDTGCGKGRYCRISDIENYKARLSQNRTD